MKSPPSGRVIRIPLVILLAVLWLPGCRSAERVVRPNVIWMLWDTVRADRLGLYGYGTPTTPNLSRFAEKARVYENCLSTAGTTVPAHAAMFTDLLPTQFMADNVHCFLDTSLVTLPEIFRSSGYRTFLYSENPYIAVETGFGGGFDRVIHPWSAPYRDEAARLIEERIPVRWRNPELGARLRSEGVAPWALCAAGPVGEQAFTEWLAASDGKRPFFAFLNYMEAHAPIVTGPEYRSRVMTPDEVDRSYALGLTPAMIWQYTLGVRDIAPADLAIISKTYDAGILELDALFGHLIATLDAKGLLENTIVVVTADHGEYLGEHHLLDHQYHLYRPVLEVPLVLYHPAKVPAGRESRPVTNVDLYPTLLELAGIPREPAAQSLSVSLLRPPEARTRVAVSRTQPEWPFAEAARVRADFDPSPWRRGILTLRKGTMEYIAETNGRESLFDLAADPGESRNLAAEDATLAAELGSELEALLATRMVSRAEAEQAAHLSPAQEAALRSLGYLGGGH